MYIDLFTVAKMLKYNLLRLTNNKHKTRTRLSFTCVDHGYRGETSRNYG
jgi:hypothetical protein